MAINKKLLHFNEYQNFNSKKLSANSDNTQYTLGISDQIYSGEDLDIKYQSIVFIKDTKQIWTHGQLYNSQDIDLSEYLTEEQIKALIPAKLSELSNDVGFITEANIDEIIYEEIYNQIINITGLKNYYTKEEVDNLVTNIPESDYVKHEIFDPFKQSIEDSISDLYKNKQDRLEDGEIILHADNTKIVDGTTSKTLAEFTKNYISLNIFGDMYSDLYGEDVVTDILDIESPTKGKAVKLDYDLVKTWKAGDFISIKLSFNDFQKSKLTSLNIKSLDAENLLFDDVQIAVEEITNEVFKTVILNRSLVSIQDGFAIIGGNLPDNIEVRSILKQELKRTGIDIENGQITLDAATTVIRDGDTDKSLATFTKDQINLSVYDDAIDELTGKVDATSLTLEQGALTIDADKTIIKDSGLTLAQFTKDQASISVYDSIEETLGDNAISNVLEKSLNKITYSINSEIQDKWAYEQDLKLIIKFAEHAKKFIDSLTITSAFDEIELNNEDINKFVFKDIIWKGRPGQTGVLTLEAEFKPEDILPGLESLIETVELRQTIKSGLKRTGIDIESGLITLDADKTLIKGNNQTLAEFTNDRISFNVLGKNLIHDIPIHEASNRNEIYYADYNVYDIDYAKTIKVGDVLQYSFVIIPKEDVSEVTLSGNNAFIQMFGSTTISKTLTKNNKHTISGTIQCKKSYSDALSSVGVSVMYARVYASVDNSQGELYIGNVQGLKRTGIDIENGIIALDSEKTIIKDSNQTLAEFTTDKISLQIQDIEEGLSSTGIDIENGTITLQAGETFVTTQDGQKTLAAFTEDLISLKVQEDIYTEENGIDVVGSISYNMATQSSTITLNRGTKTWKTGDVIEVLLEMESYSNSTPKLTLTSQFTPEEIYLDNKKFNHEPKAFTVKSDIAGTVSMQVDGKIKFAKVYRVLKYELKNTGIDIESGTITLQANTTKIIDAEGQKTLAQFTKDQIDLSVYDDAIDELTGKVDATSVKLENGTITLDADNTIIKNDGSTLATFTDDKISLQVGGLKGDLNSTGIDIESGLITLDADKTLIKGSEQTLAEFTDDKISFKVGDYDVNAVGSITFDQSKQTSTIYLYPRSVENWASGDDIIVKLTFTKIPSFQVTLTWNNVDSAIPSKSVTITNLNSIIEFTCTKNISTSSTASLIVSGGQVKEAVIYRKFNDAIKYTGINLESGQITLNSDRTVIKSGDKQIALFSTNENGDAVISTELIDAEKISANKLETKGIINEDKKTNYITISNNSMIVYDDNEEPKTIIHSGTLASVTNDSSAGIPYKRQNATLTKDINFQSIVLTDPISTTFETNYSYLQNLRITIARTRFEQGSAGTSTNNIILTPYLYTIGSDNKHNRFYTFSTYTITSNEMPLGSYSGSIEFSGRAPLQKGITYYLALEIGKLYSDDYNYTITIEETNQFVIKKISAVTEIASDGYNFNFSESDYQNADQSGFVTTYGEYGLKIDSTGIFVTKTAKASIPTWINLFERLGIN